MRRSASEIISGLEQRIARLEGKTASNTPIKMEYPSNPGSPRSKMVSQTVSGLKAMLKEVQALYDEGTYLEDPNDEFEEINVPWDVKDWSDQGDRIVFSVDHEIKYDGNRHYEVSKTDICKAMCEAGLLDKVIDNFLKNNLRT